MPRFARMLAEGMKERGHNVEILSPQAKVSRLPAPKALRKWLHYIDQYITFPSAVRKGLSTYSPDTLFVFTDHALGPWVPLVADRPHVVHCHDFLAQWSALGAIPENPTGWSGQQYQKYIRQGYSQAKNFISVSRKTQQDLAHFLPTPPRSSETVYNALNQKFGPVDIEQARASLTKQTGIDLNAGYLLHIGGNQWYKNRAGVIEIYTAWRKNTGGTLPLLLIGEAPTLALEQLREQSGYQKDIHFLTNISDEFVQLAYAGASVFLFPSLAEGFGWPIAEAMASGCLVLTTNEAPMTEVAGDAGFLAPRRPAVEEQVTTWADEAAQVLQQILSLSPIDRSRAVEAGILNAKRFEPKTLLDQIEKIYLTCTKETAEISSSAR
ncbi:glycosyltransferase [Hymenobacter sp. YC55]|uniref:glycosyltransferase n=1 Tax=Hymenobacter sp. YC55 TaxID=3034019 RepID=UPI0023F63ACD|nr:glycosyltransferase [Hymenobacter sp. YC55]MDF7814276.1 glycosyltransferase [Hymenobacter sp. YC55]